jgi:hypothetical protein
MWFLRKRETKSTEEANKALLDARQNLREVRGRGREVSKVADALREIRERNHFIEQLEDIVTHRRGLT